MIQEIELNGVKVKVEITKEMARKVLEESEENEEVEIGESYYCMDSCGTLESGTYIGDYDKYRNEVDNYLPKSKYAYDKAKEYFDKRDARRAAEYRIKKAIEKMNGGKDLDSEMVWDFTTDSLNVVTNRCETSYPDSMRFNQSIGDYMLEHHTEDYKIYWEIE